ncbi:ThuA domain-containing protein [Roseimaritima ulvae]|uniref:Trehalose utilization n=1 Tax=Roseimaritima ulvae TaxID=980254 RepID=A0A5B9QZH4_9BACT|nr:ThuA domain-containing protein [Roseimaritima ulvae]QEG42576.1 Trehalose utilization [Roseimaritima ulvae]
MSASSPSSPHLLPERVLSGRLLPGLLLAAMIGVTLGGPAWGQTLAAADDSPASNPPVKILLITGGCCHDYAFQTKAMQLALNERGVAAQWTVINDGGNGTKAKIDLYNNPQWSDGFDVVIHNECFAGTTDAEYIRRITKAHHAGANAVVIHCAMHTYRGAEIDDWRKFLGVTSRRHDHQSHYPVEVVAEDHPVMEGFPKDYVSAKDELYVIEKVWPSATPLATSKSEQSGKSHPVYWVNRYGKARVFGTTYGHSNETFQDKVFLDTLCRGIQWAAGQL